MSLNRKTAAKIIKIIIGIITIIITKPMGVMAKEGAKAVVVVTAAVEAIITIIITTIIIITAVVVSISNSSSNNSNRILLSFNWMKPLPRAF